MEDGSGPGELEVPVPPHSVTPRGNGWYAACHEVGRQSPCQDAFDEEGKIMSMTSKTGRRLHARGPRTSQKFVPVSEEHVAAVRTVGRSVASEFVNTGEFNEGKLLELKLSGAVLSAVDALGFPEPPKHV